MTCVKLIHMKKAFTSVYTYVILGIGILVCLGTSLLPIYAQKYGWFGIDYIGFVWQPDWVVLFFVVIFTLAGWLLQDQTKAHVRRKTKNWNGDLPQEVKDKAWLRSMPFYLSAITCLIIAFIMLIITTACGKETIRAVILGL